MRKRSVGIPFRRYAGTVVLLEFGVGRGISMPRAECLPRLAVNRETSALLKADLEIGVERATSLPASASESDHTTHEAPLHVVVEPHSGHQARGHHAAVHGLAV